MTAGADLRVLRAAVFTAVCVVLSAAGHLLAEHETLPPWTLAAAFGAVFLLVALPLAGRERSLPGIAATLAAGQLSLHTLFSYGQHAAMATHTTATGGHSVVATAGRLLCGGHPESLTPAQARRIVSLAGLPTHGTGHAAHPAAVHGPEGVVRCLESAVHCALAMLTVPMLLGHLLAALAAGWLLRRGDAALWRLVRLSAEAAEEWVTVRALRAALYCVRALLDGLLPGAELPHVRAAAPAPRPPARTHLRHALQRRGPPATTDRLALAA
jgi:hypothetical protein